MIVSTKRAEPRYSIEDLTASELKCVTKLLQQVDTIPSLSISEREFLTDLKDEINLTLK